LGSRKPVAAKYTARIPKHNSAEHDGLKTGLQQINKLIIIFLVIKNTIIIFAGGFQKVAFGIPRNLGFVSARFLSYEF
jgi:hypothetical protein